MPYYVWIYSALISLSIPVLWWGLTGPKAVSSRAVRNLGAQRSSDLRVLRLEQPPVERILLPVLKGVGRTARKFTPVAWLQRYERLLGEAGKLGRWTPEQVLGAKMLLPAVLGLWGILNLGGDPSARQVSLVILTVGIGFFAPDLLVRAMADRRKDQIQLELPDVLDQLTMSVEAGLSFEAALGRLAAKERGVLAEEFARLMQDIRLGTPRVEALAGLANRSGVEDLRHVVLSLRQAEKLGAPLAKTLRTMAEQMRIKRTLLAEEKAHKLPIKMIFPLALCILPALLIVILVPAFIRLYQVF